MAREVPNIRELVIRLYQATQAGTIDWTPSGQEEFSVSLRDLVVMVGEDYDPDVKERVCSLSIWGGSNLLLTVYNRDDWGHREDEPDIEMLWRAVQQAKLKELEDELAELTKSLPG